MAHRSSGLVFLHLVVAATTCTYGGQKASVAHGATASDQDAAAFGVGVSFEKWTLDTLESDVLDDTGATVDRVDIGDVDRERLKLRGWYGTANVSVFLDVLQETFFDDFDLAGVGIGVQGAPVLGGSETLRWYLPFELGLSYEAGEADVTVVDLSGIPIGTTTQKVDLLEGSARIGIGAEWRGWRPSAGVYASHIFHGTFETSGAPGTGELHGSYFGELVALDYRFGRVPLTARVEGRFGDMTGISASIAWRF